MDPLTIGFELLQYAPKLVKWFTGSDKDAVVAEKAIDIAKFITNKETPKDALSALATDPALVLKYQEAIQAQEVSFRAMAVQNAANINTTMQAETASEHWPSFSWRPAIGFAVALATVLSALTVFVAFVAAVFFSRPEALASLPATLAAMAGVIAVVSPVLGIASYFRGKMQADPAIPTNNLG